MASLASTVVTPLSPGRLFARLRRWLKRLDEELFELRRQQRHFRALQNIWTLNMGKISRPEIGRWMAQGHVAFACSAIRRLVERPQTQEPTEGPKERPKADYFASPLAARNTKQRHFLHAAKAKNDVQQKE